MTQPISRVSSVQSEPGIALSVTQAGADTDCGVVFVHGILQSALSWKYQLSAPELASWKTVAYDLRGHGFSSKPVGRAHYADGGNWARDLQAVIDATGLRRVVLVGWSFGGRVMLDFIHATDRVEQVAGLVFIDANTKTAPGHVSEECVEVLGRTVSDHMAENISARRQFIDMCFETPPTAGEIEEMIAYNNMTTPDVLRGMLGRPIDHDATMRTIRAPTLVIHGAEDRLSLPQCARHTSANISGAELLILPSVGHTPQIEVPDLINQLLGRFAQDVML